MSTTEPLVDITIGPPELLKVWDATTGEVILVREGHRYGVESMTFSPDGTRLATALGADGGHWAIKIWAIKSGQAVLEMTINQPRDFGCMTFSPDGKCLVVATGMTMKVRDAVTGREVLALKGHSGRVRSVAFGPDGERIASAGDDKKVKIWDAVTGQEMLNLEEHAYRVTSLSFSPDGQRLASASDDGTVKIWDARPLEGEPAKPGPGQR